MKKLAVLLSAVMVLAFAAPAMAADINFSGSLEASTSWNETEGFGGSNTAKLNLGLTAGENTKAVIEFGGFEDEEVFGGDYDAMLGDMAITKAYIETTGALWDGGDEVSTRLGSLDVAYSPYVATHSEDGISVNGFDLGPVTAGGFYAWTGTEQAQGLNLAGSIEGIDFNGTIARAGENMAWAVEGSTLLIDGMEVDAAYAMDMANEADLIRAQASYQAADNVTVLAGYRSVDAAFNPAFAERTYDSANNRTDWVGSHLDEHGFNVGVETTQNGVDLSAMYDDPTKKVNLDAATEYEGVKLTGGVEMDRSGAALALAETTFGAEKAFEVEGNTITGNYNATIRPNEAIEHNIGAVATINAIPQLQGLELSGNVQVVGTELNDYNARADYTAPNGLSVGVAYDMNDGASADAGIKVAF